MKFHYKIKYCLVFLILAMFACDKEDGPETIFVYFPEAGTSVVENSGTEVEIPVKVFSTEILNEDLTINYSINGGSGRLQDQGSGSILIKSGYKAYTEYIRLSPVDNGDSDGDAAISIELQAANPKVVIGLGANNMNSSNLLNVLDDDIACLAELWTGNLNCTDGIWPSYSPSYCTGAKVGDACDQLIITFDFWQMSSLETSLELKLGEIDPITKQGTVSLLNDVNAVGGGYDITFSKGDAGTFDANTFELNLVIPFAGYDIGGDGKYRFTIKNNISD